MFNCKKGFLKKVCVSNFLRLGTNLFVFLAMIHFFVRLLLMFADVNPRVMEVSQFLKFRSKAIVLVCTFLNYHSLIFRAAVSLIKFVVC